MDRVFDAGAAEAFGLDVRDLESGLVRLDLAHGRTMACCPGGQGCAALRGLRRGVQEDSQPAGIALGSQMSGEDPQADLYHAPR